MVFPNKLLADKVKNAPLLPGCYLYKDEFGKVLYVGKALVLRDRLQSYFAEPQRLEAKIINMLKQAYDIDYLTTDSEFEALALENNLIKKYRPKYNRINKDDKNYLWIEIDKKEDFPKINLVRDKSKKSAEYFGPFVASMPIKRIIRMLRRIFPYRTCNRIIKEIITEDNGNKSTKIYSSNSLPCLYYHLGLCQAPCAGLIRKNTYRANVKKIIRFLKSGKKHLVDELQIEMQKLAGQQDYEKAKILRDQISDLNYVSQKIDVDINTDETSFIEEKLAKRSAALEDLIMLFDNNKLSLQKINFKDKEFKIECYDISNIQGTNPVGSMVVFVNGEPAKKLYRKFHIRSKSTPDDFGMLQEVFGRRFKKIKNKDKNDIKSKTSKYDASFNILPDLIIVDGGKGQLSVAYQVLTEKKLDIPVAALAKKNEDLFLVKEVSGELLFVKKILSKNSLARFLLQRIRDEAHRFGVKYHRKLRTKGMTVSFLDQIPGIGKVLRNKLFKAFGNIQEIRNASSENLTEIIKNKRTLKKLQKILKNSQK